MNSEWIVQKNVQSPCHLPRRITKKRNTFDVFAQSMPEQHFKRCDICVLKRFYHININLIEYPALNYSPFRTTSIVQSFIIFLFSFIFFYFCTLSNRFIVFFLTNNLTNCQKLDRTEKNLIKTWSMWTFCGRSIKKKILQPYDQTHKRKKKTANKQNYRRLKI